MTNSAGIKMPEFDGDSPSTRYLGVVPIAQAAKGEGLVIVLGSLERYGHHANLTIYLRFGSDGPGESSTRFSNHDALFPFPMVAMSDEMGTNYTVHFDSGGGGEDWRMNYRITPGIPASVRLLTIRIDGIGWEPVDSGEMVDVTPGPWQFEVDLSRQLDATPS